MSQTPTSSVGRGWWAHATNGNDTNCSTSRNIRAEAILLSLRLPDGVVNITVTLSASRIADACSTHIREFDFSLSVKMRGKLLYTFQWFPASWCLPWKSTKCCVCMHKDWISAVSCLLAKKIEHP